MSLEDKYMNRDVSKLLNFCKDLSRAGGEVAKNSWDKKRELKEKAETDFVSDADYEVEELIIARIKEKYPEDQIITEEKLSSSGTNSWSWILDPIDGTKNYIKKIPIFCVSLAVKKNDNLIAGVIYDPLRDDIFYGAKGKGAFYNDKSIKVSEENSLKRATVATEISFINQTENNPIIDKKNINLFGDIRTLGSTALQLAYTAAGKIDLSFFKCSNLWDLAAGLLLIKEAGGCAYTFSKKPFNLKTSKSLVLGPEELVEEFCGLD